MFRILLYLLSAVLMISFLRGVIGVVAKAFSALVSPPQQARAGPTAAKVPLTGELKRDPVCGTYVPVATSIKHTAGPETVYFCSAACRDKYLAG